MTKLSLFWLAGILAMLSHIGAIDVTELDVIQKFGSIEVLESKENYHFQSSGLPDHDHGPFPNDHNPNTATAQSHNFSIPKVPKLTESPGCLPMGSIGVALNGVALYNPFTSDGNDAVTGEFREIFDDCDGHPDVTGTYHYHQIPGCIFDNSANQLIGVALDGFPIYGPIDENGNTLVSLDLDMCHGRVVDGAYRYHMTYTYPYILGCFRGEYTRSQRGPKTGNGGPPPNGGPPRDGGPPPNGAPPRDGGPPPNGDGTMGSPNMPNCDYANATKFISNIPDNVKDSASSLLPTLAITIFVLLIGLWA